MRPVIATPDDDPFFWLEDVQGEAALAWVHARNAESRAVLAQHPRFAAMRERFRAILDASDRIPQVSRRGDALYNFWRDAEHPRGLWRRSTLASYRQAQPDWETVLDLDALARDEGENWVWAGASCLGPDYRRCLLQLSRGGADATVLREFDSQRKCFVEDGFTLPEAKTRVCWEDANTLLVGTDTGPGSLTDSGYPRLIKRWQRGRPLAEARTVFEAQPQDVSASVWTDRRPGRQRIVVARATDFYNARQFILDGETLRPIAIPDDAEISFWGEFALLTLRSDWAPAGQTWPAGALLVGDAEAVLAATSANLMPPLQALFSPTPNRSLAGHDGTRSQLLLTVLDQVVGRLEAWTPPAAAGSAWQGREITVPGPGTLGVLALHDAELSDDALADSYLLGYTDFLTPDSLLIANSANGANSADSADHTLSVLKSLPASFDATGLQVQQHFARSADGTRVPYFQIGPVADRPAGRQPTLLYGYGGFEVSKQPWYSAAFGSAWLSQGGVLVVANLRGGGEFGPAWHQAAVRQHKQRSYDDLAAVAEDLIARGVTQPAQLGIQGGSNGGLLVGAVMLQRPELFGAVVCQVPLLDMRRYHKLLAGASWMAEYGNPDLPDEWAWISRYSPYQTLRPGMTLPPVLFTTSTRDDRVHPGHARKMAARMTELGHAPLYYENTEGGHAGAADNAQKADMLALEFAFLWQQLQPA